MQEGAKLGWNSKLGVREVEAGLGPCADSEF